MCGGGGRRLKHLYFHLGPDVILNTKIHKLFGSHKGSLTQSMHHSEIYHYDHKDDYSWLILQTLSARLKENQANVIASSPNPLMKAL